MPGQLAAKMVELGGDFHLPLGEAAGDALDAIGSNDGAVTLGAGVRNVAALNDQGDGALEFDGVATTGTRVIVTDHASIQNWWAGGGTVFVLYNANSQGPGSGRIYDKSDNANNAMQISNESGGNVRLNFAREFDLASGFWHTAVDVPITTTIIWVVTFDEDSDANQPTFYVHDGTSLTTRTVGGGLTELITPSGTAASDAGGNLWVGNRTSVDSTFDGEIDELAHFPTALDAADVTALVDLALSEIAASGSGTPQGAVVGGQMAGNAPHSFRTRMVGT